MTATIPPCQDAIRWLRRRGWKLGALTGQDYSVLTAVAHCWVLWVRGDADGQAAAIDAAAALLDGCQEVVWPMARELIAEAGDWCHRDVVWRKVVLRFEERLVREGRAPSLIETERAARLARCHEGHPQVEAHHG